MTGEIISVEEWRKRLTPGILTSIKNAGVVLRERAPLPPDASDYLLGIIVDFIDAIRGSPKSSTTSREGTITKGEKEEAHKAPACPTCLEKAVEKLCALPNVDAEQCRRALELFAEGRISAEGLVLLFRDRWGVSPHEIMKAFG